MDRAERSGRYNKKLDGISIPPRIFRLPVSPTGFPVPWFVASIDGVPDFRVAAQEKIVVAHNKKLCWVCGDPLGRNLAMILGPMCTINRTIAEPPSHRACAIFSAVACPFLSNPRARRNEFALPDERIAPAGFGIERNPGAVCVYVTREVKAWKPPYGNDGVLFTFGDPIEVLWFAEGRTATRQEVIASIDSGMPILLQAAEAEGPESVAELHRYAARAQAYLPKE